MGQASSGHDAGVATRNVWAAEGGELIRAVSGGLLFGIPLLFTMEVWWVGTYTEAWAVLAALGATFVPVWFLNRTSGFRSGKDIRLSDSLMDSVEAVAIGMVSAALLLLLLHEITFTTPLREAIGKAVFEAAPFGIGVALAHHFLRRSRTEGDEDEDGSDGTNDDEDRLHATVADIGATAIGAVFIGFNIAPTDEVPLIATRLSPVALALVVATSLAVSFCIVFVAGFSDQERRHEQQGLFQRPASETVAAYLVALVVAAAMLLFFQKLDPAGPWQENLALVVVLGLPASVGGAAGRLVT